MDGKHAFSTDRTERRRKVYFSIGAIGLLISLYGGPFLVTLTGISQFAGTSISFMIGASATYFVVSRGLWKVDTLSSSLASPPDLRGKWEGHLYTSSDEYNEEDVLAVDELGHGLAKMKATVHIGQTWDTIGVAFDGPETGSDSNGATFLLNDGQDPTLIYNYENDGDELGDLDHIGTTVLDYDRNEDALEGTYYTGPERGNYGLIKIQRADIS